MALRPCFPWIFMQLYHIMRSAHPQSCPKMTHHPFKLHREAHFPRDLTYITAWQKICSITTVHGAFGCCKALFTWSSYSLQGPPKHTPEHHRHQKCFKTRFFLSKQCFFIEKIENFDFISRRSFGPKPASADAGSCARCLHKNRRLQTPVPAKTRGSQTRT